MKTKAHVRAGSYEQNYNETLVSDPVRAKGLKVKTRVRAGGFEQDHNETLVRDKRRKL
jgi:hypothetical protein